MELELNIKYESVKLMTKWHNLTYGSLSQSGDLFLTVFLAQLMKTFL